MATLWTASTKLKTDLDELGLIESTGSDLARSILKGGWIESWVWCQIDGCKEPLPHKHYICPSCGGIDFGGLPKCGECRRMQQIHSVGRGIADFKKKHGMALHRMGLAIVATVLAVVSTLRVKG